MYTPFTRDVADVRKKLMEEVDAFDTCNMVKFLRAVVPFVNEQWGAGVEVKIVLVTDAGLGGHGQFSLPGLLKGGVPDFDVCFPFPFRGQGSLYIWTDFFQPAILFSGGQKETYLGLLNIWHMPTNHSRP